MKTAAAVAIVAGLMIAWCSDPILSFALTAAFGRPASVYGSRWSGPGDFSARRVVLASPAAELTGVRTRGFAAFALGGVLRVRFDALKSRGLVFGPSAARVRRVKDGVSVFTTLKTGAGQARGGLLWRNGVLAKADGRVTLSLLDGMNVPKPWIRRLGAAGKGFSFVARFGAGKFLVRGPRGPIFEAAWQPAG